jgi:hypothetical protein
MKYKMHIGALYDSYAPPIFTQSVVGIQGVQKPGWPKK